MGGSSSSTSSNSVTNTNTAQNSAANSSSQMAFGTNTGNQYGQNSGQNSVQTYAPSDLAQSYLKAGTTPAYSNVSNYYNPYQQQVINSTMQQLGQQFGSQNQAVLGNAIANGALGGDRQAVAQAALAGQQGLAAGATLAGLNSQGYQQALAASMGQNAQNLQAAGMSGGTSSGQSLSSILGQSLGSTMGLVDAIQATSGAATGASSSATSSNGTSSSIGGSMGGMGKGSGGAIRRTGIPGVTHEGHLASGGRVHRDSGGGIDPIQMASSDNGLSAMFSALHMLNGQGKPQAPQIQFPQQKESGGSKGGGGSGGGGGKGGNQAKSLTDKMQGQDQAQQTAEDDASAVSGGSSDNSGGASAGADSGANVDTGAGADFGGDFDGSFARGGMIRQHRASGGGSSGSSSSGSSSPTSGPAVSAPSISAPNVSMPTLSGLQVLAPNVRMPQFAIWVPDSTGSGNGEGDGPMGGAGGGNSPGKPSTGSGGSPSGGHWINNPNYISDVYAPMPWVPQATVPQATASAPGGKGSGGAIRSTGIPGITLEGKLRSFGGGVHRDSGGGLSVLATPIVHEQLTSPSVQMPEGFGAQGNVAPQYLPYRANEAADPSSGLVQGAQMPISTGLSALRPVNPFSMGMWHPSQSQPQGGMEGGPSQPIQMQFGRPNQPGSFASTGYYKRGGQVRRPFDDGGEADFNDQDADYSSYTPNDNGGIGSLDQNWNWQPSGQSSNAPPSNAPVSYGPEDPGFSSQASTFNRQPTTSYGPEDPGFSSQAGDAGQSIGQAKDSVIQSINDFLARRSKELTIGSDADRAAATNPQDIAAQYASGTPGAGAFSAGVMPSMAPQPPAGGIPQQVGTPALYTNGQTQPFNAAGLSPIGTPQSMPDFPQAPQQQQSPVPQPANQNFRPNDPTHIMAQTVQTDRGSGQYGAKTNGFLTVNGHQYPFFTGGAGRGSAPYGTYQIGGPERKPYLNPNHPGNVAYPLSSTSDPRAGADRTGFFIHPGRNVTEGCIGIPQQYWSAFQKDMAIAGPQSITISPKGEDYYNGSYAQQEAGQSPYQDQGQGQQGGLQNISSRLETGSGDPYQGVGSINTADRDGTHSYGNLGLNSQPGGSAFQFQQQYGQQFGLVGTPGSALFDNSWREAAARDPQGLVQAENDFWKNTIADPTTASLQKIGVPEEFANDPRVQSYFADRAVQQGVGSTENHADRILSAARNADSPEQFLQNVGLSDKMNLKHDFRTYLGQHPDHVRGLENRVDNRLNAALRGGDQGQQPSGGIRNASYAPPQQGGGIRNYPGYGPQGGYGGGPGGYGGGMPMDNPIGMLLSGLGGQGMGMGPMGGMGMGMPMIGGRFGRLMGGPLGMILGNVLPAVIGGLSGQGGPMGGMGMQMPQGGGPGSYPLPGSPQQGPQEDYGDQQQQGPAGYGQPPQAPQQPGAPEGAAPQKAQFDPNSLPLHPEVTLDRYLQSPQGQKKGYEGFLKLQQLEQGIVDKQSKFASAQRQQAANAAFSSVPSDLQGDEFIEAARKSGVNADDLATAKSWVDGTGNPANVTLRGDHRQYVENLARRIDPSYTSGRYAAAQGARTKMSSKQWADTQVAANKAINHTTDLLQSVPGLGNYSSSWANAITGPIAEQYNKPYQAALAQERTARDGVSGELAKVFKGVGATSEKEINDWKNNYSEYGSPTKTIASAQEAMQMMMGQLDPMVAKVNEELGLKPGDKGYKTGRDLLAPETRERYDKIMSMDPTKGASEIQRVFGNAPSQQQSAPAIPQGAVQMLQQNPGLAADFDAKYGKGASQQYLRQ